MTEQPQKNYYPDSEILESEGSVLNNQKQGAWKFYYPDGGLKSQGSYQDDLAEGEFEYFSEEGKITTKGGFKKGKWDGLWSWYDKNEFEYHKGHYLNAFRSGQWLWYYANGSISREMYYAHDQYHGSDTSYFQNGQVSCLQHWNQGKLDGAYEKRDEQGNIIEQGNYKNGFRDGTFVFHEKGKTKEISYEIGVPALEEKQINQILKALTSKKDSYQIEEAIEKVVGWEAIYPSIWYLIKFGYKIPVKSLNFSGLSGLTEALTSEHLLMLLKNTDFSEKDKENSGSRMFKFWSYHLDQMCMHLYHKHPEAFDAVWQDFSPLAKEGFKTVLVRFGKLSANKLSKKIAYYLAYNLLHQQCNGYKVYAAEGVSDNVWWYENGTLTELNTHEPENLKKFIETFVSFEDFRAVLLKDALTFEWNLPIPQADMAIQEASVEQFTKLYKAFTTSDYKNFYRAFLELRNDSIEEIEQIVHATKEEYRTGQKAETAIIVGILKRKQENKSVPEWYDDLITFDSFYNGVDSAKNWFVGIEQTKEALLYLPEERLQKIFERILQEKYLWKQAFPLMSLVNQELQNQAIGVLVEKLENDLTIYNVQPLARGLSQVENIDWLDKMTLIYAAQRKVYEVLTIAMIFRLSTMAEKQTLWEEKYDQHLELHLWMPKYGDDFDYYLQSHFENILKLLPKERILKQFLPQIDAEKATTIRIFSLLSDNSSEELLEKAFEVAASGKVRILNTNWIQRCLTDKLKFKAEKMIRYALEKGANGELLNTFKNAIGEEKLKKIYAGLNGNNTVYQELTPANLLKQLCEAYFKKYPQSSKRTIYYLSPDYDKNIAENQISRIRGTALSIRPELVPQQGEEPMNHIFTLDLDMLPMLKKAVGEQYKALAFFSYETDWENPSRTVLLKAEDILEIPASEGGYSFEVTEIQVPTNIFYMSYSEETNDQTLDLKDIRKKVFNAPAYVLGEPIWIQEPEDLGDFYMQFDDRFGDMNLGDSGVMYVFAQDAFWQCY